MELDIRLPPLHSGGQLEIAEHPARFKVCMCGRRYGKTHLGVYLCVKTSIQGKRTWWVAPTYKIANEGWTLLKSLAKQINSRIKDKKLHVEIREADMQIIFTNGGMVEVRSSDTEDALRGAGLDGVVIDEAAKHRETVWTEELRPALIDKRGWALFIGTPKGVNWFSRLYDKAMSGRPNWQGWKYDTWQNPHITNEERIELESEYVGLPDKLRQEIYADIGASSYLVYSQFSPEIHCWRKPIPDFVRFFGGMDFGGTSIGSHKSASLVAGLTQDDILIFLNEFEQAGPNIAERQMDWVALQEHLIYEIHRITGKGTGNILWKADKTQMFGIQLMRSAGHIVWPSKGGPDSVEEGIEMVARRLAVRGDGLARIYYLPHLKYFPEAMMRYRYAEPDEDPDSLKLQPKKPLKVRDDTADAIRYLVEGVDYFVVGNPEQYARGQLATVE